MWFSKDKSTDAQEDNTQRVTKPSRGASDMRSTLGLGAETEQRAPVRRTKEVAGKADATGKQYDADVILNDIKVRARRRMIGAFTLLAFAFVALPWVFDGSRKQVAPVVKVSVPAANIAFDVQNTQRPSPANDSNATQPEPVATTKPEAKPEAKPNTKPNEPKPAEPVAAKSKFVVHIGLVSSKAELDGLIAKLSAKGAKPMTEKVKASDGSTKTRVRLGPFDSMAAAQTAADKIQGAAKKPLVLEVK